MCKQGIPLLKFFAVILFLTASNNLFSQSQPPPPPGSGGTGNYVIGELAAFLIEIPETEIESGTPFSINLEAVDGAESRVDDFTGTVDLYVYDTNDQEVSGPITTDPFTEGTLLGYDVTIQDPGNYYIHVVNSDSEGDQEGVSEVFEVELGMPHHITLTGPESVTAGEASAAFTITVRDSDGNPFTVKESTTFTLSTDQASGSAVFA
ncbi:MAG: hypothetical protein ACLFN2_07990, partial [Bacteroidales bacterium]